MTRSFGLFFAAVFLLLSTVPAEGQFSLQKITQPDAVGGSFVATHLDGLVESNSMGPGFELFLRYNVTPKVFVTVGTGISTIYDDVLTSNNFKSTLFPTVDLKLGYNLLQDTPFSPFVFAGLQAFGWTTTVGTGPASDRYYDGSVFAGGGIGYAFNPQWAFHVSGDYRYVVSATSDPKPKHWVAKAGLTYALQPKEDVKREEIEYPLDSGELALDDLFREESTGGEGEEDALALLFSSEAESAAAETEETTPVTYPDTEVGQLMARIQNMKDELDQRRQQIENLQTQVRTHEKAIAELTGRVAGEYTGLGGGSFGVGSVEDFKANYEMGLQQFYSRKYVDAVRVFKGLLSSNPDHRLASNCQYWIGESYNAMGEYSQAIEAFNAVLRYRSSYKLDDALLMNGLCHLKLGDRATAREKFQELVSRYPDSEYAPKALRYLGSL